MSITCDIDIDSGRTGTRQVRTRDTNDVIQWFLDYYWIRHPISERAIAAYRADLLALDHWLTASRNTCLQSAGPQDLRAFLDSHYKTDGRSLCQIPSVACIKRFFFYLVEVGLRSDDPTERVYVRMPRREKYELTVIQGDRA